MPAAKKRVLSIDDILDADDLPTSTVDCPEWGGVVEIKALSRQAVLDTIEKCTGDEDFDNPKFQILLVIQGLGVTEDRVQQLNKKHPAPIKRISEEMRRISGLDGGAVFQQE